VNFKLKVTQTSWSSIVLNMNLPYLDVDFEEALNLIPKTLSGTDKITLGLSIFFGETTTSAIHEEHN